MKNWISCHKRCWSVTKRLYKVSKWILELTRHDQGLPHCQPRSPETPSAWQRARGRQMGTNGCLDAATGGSMLSGRECPDARAQPKITFHPCGVLETTHWCQTSGAAWASTSEVPDLCNPESVASWCRRLLENTGQCAVGVEKWADAWQTGLVAWLAF